MTKPLILQAIEFTELAALDFPEGAAPHEIAEIEAAWEAELAERYADIKERFGAIGRVIARETFLAEQHDAEINALKRELELRQAARGKHIAHVERVKRYAVKCLETLGGSPVEAEGKVYKLRKNPPALKIDDPAAIPDEYTFTERVIDKSLVKDAIAGGLEVAGARLIRGHSLDIKGA